MKLFKRPDSNKWWFKFNYKGRRHRRSTDIEDTGKKSEQDALTIANAYRTDVIRGEYGVAEDEPAPLLKDAIEDWFTLYVQVEHSGSPQTQQPDELAFILRQWQITQKAAWLNKGKPMPELVFAGEDGGYLNESRFRNTKFYPVRTQAGLTTLRLHDLRHCYASYMLAQGPPLSDLKEYMGHHSIQITVDPYGHMVPRKENSHANAMAQMLLSKGKEA